MGCSQVLNPAGPVGAQQKTILLNSLSIMLAIIIPTIVLMLVFAWWYRAGNSRAHRQPDFVYSGKVEMVTWSIPLLTIMFLGGITWIGSHSIDPAKPIESSEPALEIQVIALDWKWLFDYPEQDLASINRIVIPVGRSLRFRITSASVMNSFFIPRLGSMIYAMNGMVSDLNLRADEAGHYHGLATHFSGDGFSDMHFVVDAVNPEDFATWVQVTKQTGPRLDRNAYERLAQQSVSVANNSYSSVEPGLFESIVRQEIAPGPGPIDVATNHDVSIK